MPNYDDATPKYSRNPLPPQQLGERTPPTIEELLRRPTNEDADTAHNASVARRNTHESLIHTNTTRSSYSSQVPSALSRSDTGRSSIASFARGLVRHVPDMKVFLAPETADEHQNEYRVRGLRGHGSSGSFHDSKQGRRLSFMLPPPPNRTNTEEQAPEPSLGQRKSSHKSCVNDQAQQPRTQKSLSARRKVNLEVSLPVVASQAANINRSATVTFSSITPSRPRSPKTPCVRNGPPARQQNVGRRPVPILEDTQGRHDAYTRTEAFGLLPGDDILSSSYSPEHEGPATKMRYVTRPRSKRNRSGRSGTSESELAGTPDRSWAPNDSRATHEKQARTNAELRQLAQSARTRSGRWRFTRSMTRSSDEGMQTPVIDTSTRRFSVNPFRRSDRIADQSQTDKRSDKEKARKQSSQPARFWWIGKQAATSPTSPIPAPNTPTNIIAPPVFVPPGLTKIPTPPLPDAQGEVKGKLADFFFDHTAAPRRPRPSPRGHWDSDALLMNYPSPDMILHESGDEEPLSPDYVPHSITIVEQNPSYGRTPTPGLVSPPGGYMDAKIAYPSTHPGQGTPESENMWFRVAHQVVEERQLTENALREMEERRKFEWIVPEHLPSSPLCPLHEKYRGYSKGKCFWHKDRREKRGAEGGAEVDSEKRGVEGGEIKMRRGSRGWGVGVFAA